MCATLVWSGDLVAGSRKVVWGGWPRLFPLTWNLLKKKTKKERKKDGKHRGEIAGGQRIALMMSMASKDSHC